MVLGDQGPQQGPVAGPTGESEGNMVYYVRGKFHNGEEWEEKVRNKSDLARSFYEAHGNMAIQRDIIKVSTKSRTLTDDEVWALLDE